MNASASDMANYLLFYLNRGSVNGTQILPAAAIDRMEIPTSTWAAKESLKTGYGLSNYWTVEDGFVYHGHDGGVDGGLTYSHICQVTMSVISTVLIRVMGKPWIK